jgi:subtilisin family serine protease
MSKAGAAGFWSALAAHPAAGGAAAGLASQVAKVWLDEPVHAAGGAPAGPAAVAAGSGYAPRDAGPAAPGSGVLVADLDTGYDSTHPDLKGTVAGSKDFTGSKDGMADVVGHGTWTASIIAGSGAASSGKYRGVAPGARLLIGKVLGDAGTGTESQVIAGMQWAVAQHARIVNMSLGGPSYWVCPAGIDPLSQAVNSLSASSKALFVVAAGNDGQNGPGFVESPGVAASALTVGAVDSAGKLAFFSSTGPDCGGAVKPDITALGVGVVGALAAGTALGAGDGIPGDGPINAFYTRASGTSGSTPYVTGAAAVLAQEHTSWSGAQLKAALMASAAPAAATSPYAQGDGQADLARATRQDAYATPGSAAFVSPWPHVKPATQTVTYRNAGTSTLTLNLAVAVTGPDGKPAPAGLVTVSKAQLTVAPGADASAQVTVNPAAGGTGLYSGWLTATSTGGSTVLHTAIGAESQPQLDTITFKTIDRDGRTLTDPSLALPLTALINLATGQLIQAVVDKAGTVTASVPAGRYDITSDVETSAAGKTPASDTLIDDPSVTVTRDLTVTLDARRGRPLAPALDHRVGHAYSIAQVLQTVAGTQYYSYVLALPGDPLIYAVPTGRVTGRPYDFFGDFWADNSGQTRDHLATLTYSLQEPGVQQIPALPSRVHDSALAVYRPDFRQQGKPMTRIDEIHFGCSSSEVSRPVRYRACVVPG